MSAEETLEKLYANLLMFNGHHFASLRTVLGLTTEELADLTRLSRQSIYVVENDKGKTRAALRLLIGITLMQLALDNEAATAILKIYLDEAEERRNDAYGEEAHHRVEDGNE